MLRKRKQKKEKEKAYIHGTKGLGDRGVDWMDENTTVQCCLSAAVLTTKHCVPVEFRSLNEHIGCCNAALKNAAIKRRFSATQSTSQI